MSRTARFLGGLGFGYLHLIAVTVAGLWLTPFLLGHLGQRDLGLWLIITQVVNFLGLLDLGVVTLLPRETAFVAGTRPRGERPGFAPLVARVWRIIGYQIPVVVVCAAVAWWWLPGEWQEVREPLLLVIIAFVALFPARVFNAVLQGIQDLAFVGRLQLVVWAAGTALTVALVIAGAGLYAVVLGWVFTQLAGAVGSAARAWRLAPEAFTWRVDAPRSPGEPIDAAATPAAYLKRSAWIGVSQIAQVFLAGTDMLVIGKLLGPAAVVPYSCTTKLVSVLANHPHLLMHAAAPALSELRAGGSRERLAELTRALTLVMLVASGAISCVVLASNALFVGWWVGGAQFGGWPLTICAVVMMLLRHWNTAATYTLFCFGHDRRISLTMMADGVVTLAGSFVCVWWFGPIGAAVGSLAGVVCVALPLNLRQVGRDIDCGVPDILTGLMPWLGRFAAASSVSLFLAWYLGGTGFIGLVFGAAASGLLYLAVMAPLALRAPLAPFFLPALATLRAALPLRLRGLAAARIQEPQA